MNILLFGHSYGDSATVEKQKNINRYIRFNQFFFTLCRPISIRAVETKQCAKICYENTQKTDNREATIRESADENRNLIRHGACEKMK